MNIDRAIDRKDREYPNISRILVALTTNSILSLSESAKYINGLIKEIKVD